MSNSIFGFPLYEQATPLFTPSVFAAGNWSTQLPMANVLDRRLSRIARTVDTIGGSATVKVDLGVARPVGLLALLSPNITKTSTPTVSFVGASDSLFASIVYNSGSLQAWPTGVTAEDVIGPDGTPMNVWSVNVPATPQSARYWQIQLVDTGNADGHNDVARVIIAGAYRPTRRISAGAKSSLENDTVRTETDGGATLYKARATRRVDTFSIANTPESEALTTIRRMQHRLGTSGPLFWVFDDADPYMYERSFQGTLRQLGALEYPDSMLYNTVGFEIVEDL
jgi:hypothetical protein